MHSATPAALAELSNRLLRASGADAKSADAATRAMLHASVHGVDSHGIRLLPFYGDSLSTGLVKGAPDIKITALRPAAAVLDADGGLGHVAAYDAMAEACRLARVNGIGLCLVTHSSHFGAAGAYTMAAVEAGFIGLATCNSGAFVIPHGGTRPIHGTSPISLAAPNPGGEPFLLDMATSAIPWNKVLRYRTEGLELPRDVAVDGQGHFTTDPHKAVALAPAGGADFGYKGAALAGFAEVLGGILTGMRLSRDQDGLKLGDTEVGHCLLAIDPTLLMPLGGFGAAVQRYFDGFAAQPGTFAAGGPEWQRRDTRLRDGIPLPDGLYAELRAAAQKAGVTFAL